MFRRITNYLLTVKRVSKPLKQLRNVTFVPPLMMATLAVHAEMDENENSKMPTSPLKIAEPSDLSHAFLLKQSCALAADSVSRVVTQSLLAFNSAVEDYVQFLERVIKLLDLVAEIGPAAETNPTLQDKLIELRSDVARCKVTVHEMNYLLENALKFLNSAADIAFLAGVENISSLAAERIYSIEQQVQELNNKMNSLETQYNELQRQLVKEKSEEDK